MGKFISEDVKPHTFAIVPLTAPGLPEVYKVYGGRQKNIWVATFVCQDEAQAWIMGSKHFGQMVKGLFYDATGDDGRELLSGAGGKGGGSMQETVSPAEGGPG